MSGRPWDTPCELVPLVVGEWLTHDTNTADAATRADVSPDSLMPARIVIRGLSFTQQEAGYVLLLLGHGVCGLCLEPPRFPLEGVEELTPAITIQEHEQPHSLPVQG